MKKTSFTIIGGDLRNIVLGNILHAENIRSTYLDSQFYIRDEVNGMF